jgi:hypothetical protein
MNQTLQEIYNHVTSTNTQHQRNREHWEMLLESYMGGVEWQRGQHLTKYVNETQSEYDSRLAATPLENHCRSVIATYVSFLFRVKPQREFESIEFEPMLDSFLEDADLDGRSFDAFIKEAATWSSVLGHCWVIMVKPNVGAMTKGDELSQDVRPYVNLLTPLVVTDWRYSRGANGRYVLNYFKYVEDVNDTIITVKEWFPDQILTTVIDDERRTVIDQQTEPNPLNDIPVICVYNQKSPVRGLGISDISDISRIQRFIYNMTSEVEQSIRINGHPALAATAGTELTAGAGAVIRMEDNLDPGLKPYAIEVSTDVNQIYTAIEHATSVIDKMANTGSIRATEARRMSGVAQQQEFELLAAKLSEKADNLELAEEQIWQWYAYYQGYEWAGEIKYPDSFNIQDVNNDVEMLVRARQAATDPRVLAVIDQRLLAALGEDPDMIRDEPLPDQIPPTPPFDVHVMVNPVTGEQRYARSPEEHLALSAEGFQHPLEDR